MSKELHEADFALLIDAYRSSLVRRYSIENLSKYPELVSLERTLIEKLTRYFLELLYPEYKIRLELDKAFDSLAAFVKTPKKFLSVVGNIGMAIFKFGHLLFPGIKAGIQSLSCYLNAYRFEKTLYMYSKDYIAQGTDITKEEVFDEIMSKISKKEADDFRKDVLKLFRMLTQKELIQKIIEIMNYVVSRMKERPKLYTEQEVRGIELGISIIQKGKVVFDEINYNDSELILKGIEKLEKEYIERLHSRNTDGRNRTDTELTSGGF